ncbi:zinc finger protein 182-like isoform X2 [Teleopsis dalmanni]|uniref:zinc finger protein 182-like isoform X2 n=1 Tax=Teleopsis dalmanni TaxID=139649 RepID=UPI0018CEBBAE|nr:zinc finger protein 182-like isoform X2 [Teleopsis dalmanni]
MDIKVENNESDDNTFELEYVHLYCRVCLQLPQSADILDVNIIYDEDECLTYKDVFKICTEIDLLADVNLPNQLCRNCGLELQMAYDFHKKVKESKRLLTHVLRQSEIQQQDEASLAADDKSLYVEEFEDADMSLVESPEVEIEQLDLEEIQKVDEFQNLEELQNVDECDEEMETIQVKKSDDSILIQLAGESPVLKTQVGHDAVDSIDISDSDEYEQCEYLHNIGNSVVSIEEYTGNEMSSEIEPSGNLYQTTKRVVEKSNKAGIVKRKRFNGQYSCSYCGKSFPNHSRMQIHRVIHEPNNRATFNCEICGRLYTSKQAMDVHIKTTHQKTGFPCEICGKVYAIRKGLEIHMRFHNGDFPFHCDLCPKKFAQVCHLNTHINIHHNNLRFYCGVCGRVFTSSASLRCHEFTHGKMPFDCEMCGNGYPSKAKLKVHIRRKHGLEMDSEQLEKMRKFHVMRSKLNTVKLKQDQIDAI